MPRFHPPWWIRNPHLQTLWPYVFKSHYSLELIPERLELPDGDFIDLLWTNNKSKHIVIVIHGLEGSVHSHYVPRILSAIKDHHWCGLFMHFRGCSGEHNRLPRSYHSGDTGDIKFLIESLHKRYPQSSISAIGYSLGGNALLKYLGEDTTDKRLQCAVSVSVPFDLDIGARRLEKGLSRIYQRYLIRKLQKKCINKFQKISPPVNISNIKNLKTFRQFDDQITAPLHGFSGVDDYYNRSSSRQFLKSIHCPTLIIHAKDDPFMTDESIPTQSELSKHITLELSEHGGHVGFVSGQYPWKTEYWLEKRIPEYIKSKLE